jgi:O-antigen ligase
VLTKKRFNITNLALIGVSSVACFAGIITPYYVNMTGGGMVALLALPILLVLCAVFIADRRVLLLIILITRSAGDLAFESLRSSFGEQAIGPGAMINAFVILLALTLVFEKPKVVPKQIALAWLGFFITALYGIALSPQKGDALRLYLTWLSNFSIFIGAFYIVRSIEDFRFCVRLILWSSAAPAVYALYEIAAAFGSDWNAFRLQSTFTHPNIFAFYLILVICLGFYLIKSKVTTEAAASNFMLTLYLFILAGMLVLTQTRSAWFASLVIFALYGIFFQRRYIFFLILIFLVCLLVPAVRERLLDLNDGNELGQQAKLNSFAWRLSLWESAIKWIEPQRYVFGYGIGAFRENSVTFFSRSGGMKWDAHNLYIQWFFDVGLLGLAAYLWIHARLLYLLQPLRVIDRLAAFITVSIIGSYLVVSFSDNMMFYLVFNWYYWFAIGAASALVSAHVLPPAERSPRWPSVKQKFCGTGKGRAVERTINDSEKA